MKDLIVLVAISTFAAPPVTSARPGQWTCNRAQDGGSWAVLTTVSREKNAALVVRCSAGKSSISLKWGMAGGSGPVLVTTRVDDGEWTRTWWPRSVDRKESQFAGDQSAYLRALRGGETLTVRLTPEPAPVADARSSGVDDGAPQNVKLPTVDIPLEMSFDLTGLAAAISEAHGTCGTS